MARIPGSRGLGPAARGVVLRGNVWPTRLINSITRDFCHTQKRQQHFESGIGDARG